MCIGDIRDRDKLAQLMYGVTHVVHTAALKVIPNAPYNADEIVKTNIIGSMNVFRAAMDAGVEKVLFVSTDKGCEPTTFYGATKMIGEGLAVQMNRWSKTRIACVRYGNVEHSRGSFTNMIRDRSTDEPLPVTDPNMTRFWITLEGSAKFVYFALDKMEGGEIFVPRLGGKRLGDMIPPDQPVNIIGLRQDEKIHETLIGSHEVMRTDCHGEYFVIHPWPYNGNCEEQTTYRSDSEEGWGM